jgi:predicted NUDIX family NTP pyrophosphohydrolase
MAKAKLSAGLLLYRRMRGSLEVFLVHPGGPFWAKKDDGAWSIPKGEYGPEEDALTAARREFKEETGIEVDGAFFELEAVKQPSGKVIRAWAVEGDCDPSQIVSNTFEMEWPPKSGKRAVFPEVDRAEWFDISAGLVKLITGQRPFLNQLAGKLGIGLPASPPAADEQGSLF